MKDRKFEQRGVYGDNVVAVITDKDCQTYCANHIPRGLREGTFNTVLRSDSWKTTVGNCCICHQQPW